MNEQSIFQSRDFLKISPSIFKTKFPRWFWGRLPLNFKWEFLCFYRLREWQDGISFMEFQINLDRYDPLEYKRFIYKPRFNILLIVLNHTIFELSIYKDNSGLYTEENAFVKQANNNYKKNVTST